MATRKTKSKSKRYIASRPKEELTGRLVLFPKVTVCGIEIPKEDLRITAEDAKVLVGWWSDSDATNWGIAPNTEYEFVDYKGEKVRCRNTCGRPVSLAWVEHLAQEILNGGWRFNGESWVMGSTGMALNMQHRAIALIWAQQIVDYDGKDPKKKMVAVDLKKRYPQPLFIEALTVRGIMETPDVLRSLDNMRTRSSSDLQFATKLIPNLGREASEIGDGSCSAALDKLKYAASYMTWHQNKTPAPYENVFLQGISYPAHGKYSKYPYPAYDTKIEVTATVLEPNPWDEDDMPEEPFQVEGILLIRPSPFGGFQCFVTGSPTDKSIASGHGVDCTEFAVDPETVMPHCVPETKATSPKKSKPDTDPGKRARPRSSRRNNAGRAAR
jgi:hypothetical protein